LPITYSIDRAQQRLFAVAVGVVTYSEIVAHLEKERDDSGLPFPELIEATGAKVALDAAEVRQVVERLRDLGYHNALGPTAVVTVDDFSYGIMRMLETLVEDFCDVRPFRSRSDAEEWLDTIPTRRPPTQER